MATDSSTLAWRIPWTKEPKEPQSMGSKKKKKKNIYIYIYIYIFSCIYSFSETFCLCVHVCPVTKSCPTLCNQIDCSPPGSSVRGIHHARILGRVAISFFKGSSRPRDQT